MELNIKAFALASGLFWGLGIFLLTWWIILIHGATGEATWLGLVYLGYRIDTLGSFFGLLWGLADGLVCGAIFSWLYNRLVSAFRK